MLRTLLSFIISISLCAVYLTEAVAQEVDSVRLKAAQLERVVYYSDDPCDVNDALLAKAECYKQGGFYREALSTLSRVSMYMLSQEQRYDVLYQKSLCAFLCGEYDEAMVYLEEAGVEVSYREPEQKSLGLALALTLFMPAGYAYAGSPLEGVLSLALNITTITWAVTQVTSGLYVSGILGGAIGINATFTGALQRVGYLVGKRNAELVASAKCSAVREALSGL